MNYYLDTEFLEGPQRTWWGGKTKPTIDLISIGIVSEDGREYYAISKDFNLTEAWNRWQPRSHGDINNKEPKEYWIRENVLSPIFIEWVKNDSHWANKDVTLGNWGFTYNNFKYFLRKHGKSNKQIAEDVREFIAPECIQQLWSGLWPDMQEVSKHNPDEYGRPQPTFYTYYGSYDWVCFCWLFGRMIDLPKGFPMYTRDLKQMLDERLTGDMIRESQTIEAAEIVEIRRRSSLEERIHWIKEYSKYYPKQTNEHSAIHDARWNRDLHKFIISL